MIEVVEYDERWPSQFDRLEAIYEEALTGVPVVAIEHVGSTSVPGLAAKPVIDIDIVVRADDVDEASARLVDLGFEPLGLLGVPERWAFRAPGWVAPIRTNTYVTVEGCLSLRNHLAIRDLLRRDGHQRERYGALKLRLGAEHDDIDDYVRAKSALVQELLALGGLPDHERAEIAEINR